MKRFYQIIGIIVVVSLGLLLIVKFNNSKQNMQEMHHEITTSSFFSDHEHKYSVSSKTSNLKKFSKIKIKVNEADINIAKGDQFQVKVIGRNIKAVKIGVANQELTIADDSQISNDDCKLLITVPAKNAVNKISGSVNEGDVSLNDLSIADIDLQMDDGDLSINNIEALKTSFTLDEGDIKITNSTLKADTSNCKDGDLTIFASQFKTSVSLTDGDVSISNSKILDNSSFNLNDGSFQMSEAPMISYLLSTNSGNEINFRHNNYSGHFSKVRQHSPLLKVTCDNGDININ
ncbi:DUF4097 family beta strand repeat-containing protein [Lactobacillus bombicola]|uniref:DUF4097 family beta strand repeat-containing protein n=1 Tax=Lactobacillus bombicola TaxID=1505723 RepID=UPI000E572C56|nr:DUF4097 family beta strand repeat-containing protein [Lactobacillus bombicola]RHW53288.1 hypothetical protein DS833_00555 [Lactobacillus bombicola]